MRLVSWTVNDTTIQTHYLEAGHKYAARFLLQKPLYYTAKNDSS